MVAHTDKRRRNGTKIEIMYHQFSGASANGHCRFTAVIKLLAFLKLGRRVTTKRDFYYQDVELFGRNPEVAYRVVDVVLKGMNLQQGIVAGQKGLVYCNYEVQIVEAENLAEKLTLEKMTVKILEAEDLGVDEMTAVETGGASSTELLGLGDTGVGGVDVLGSAESEREVKWDAGVSLVIKSEANGLLISPLGRKYGPSNRLSVGERIMSTPRNRLAAGDPSMVPPGPSVSGSTAGPVMRVMDPSRITLCPDSTPYLSPDSPLTLFPPPRRPMLLSSSRKRPCSDPSAITSN